MNSYKEAARLIGDARRIAIAGHLNPDGDSIGSILALGGFLRQKRKEVTHLSPGGLPDRLKFLPGASQIRKTSKRKFELAISIDCASSKQLGQIYGDVFLSADKILEIDHHPVRRDFGDCVLVDPYAAAVGEIIFRLKAHLGAKLTKEIAFNILCSIVVETNSFMLPSVTQFTFKAVSELMSTGIDFYKLVEHLYWKKSKSEVILSGVCMARTRFLAGGGLAHSYINQNDIRRIGGRDEDIDAVADELRCVRSVKIVVLFREQNRSTVRVSLRSKAGIDVAGLAEEFGGAGHYDVAGCEIPNTAAARKAVLRRALELVHSP